MQPGPLTHLPDKVMSVTHVPQIFPVHIEFSTNFGSGLTIQNASDTVWTASGRTV